MEANTIAKSGSAAGLWQAIKQLDFNKAKKWLILAAASLLIDWFYAGYCTRNRGFWFTGVYGFTLKWMVPYAGINNFGCR
jgi:hypothetical protein